MVASRVASSDGPSQAANGLAHVRRHKSIAVPETALACILKYPTKKLFIGADDSGVGLVSGQYDKRRQSNLTDGAFMNRSVAGLCEPGVRVARNIRACRRAEGESHEAKAAFTPQFILAYGFEVCGEKNLAAFQFLLKHISSDFGLDIRVRNASVSERVSVRYDTLAHARVSDSYI
jgi:hypothetical protein